MRGRVEASGFKGLGFVDVNFLSCLSVSYLCRAKFLSESCFILTCADVLHFSSKPDQHVGLSRRVPELQKVPGCSVERNFTEKNWHDPKYTVAPQFLNCGLPQYGDLNIGPRTS